MTFVGNTEDAYMLGLKYPSSYNHINLFFHWTGKYQSLLTEENVEPTHLQILNPSKVMMILHLLPLKRISLIALLFSQMLYAFMYLLFYIFHLR